VGPDRLSQRGVMIGWGKAAVRLSVVDVMVRKSFVFLSSSIDE
jgi:hypothetical protein